MIGADAIPVWVLTGFLGSGKTTVLGHLLRQPEFSRTAVIINEFGEIGLDHELIETSEDSVIALTTGCLCCKVRSDLTQTLQDLLRRRDAGACTPFDRVVIETSGLADPAPILHALMTDADTAGRLVLGGVAATVDAVTGGVTLEREAISRKQIAVADRIVLSKLDLAGGAEAPLVARLAALIRARRSCKPIMAGSKPKIFLARASAIPKSGRSPPSRLPLIHGWRRRPTTPTSIMTPKSDPLRSCVPSRSRRSR